MICPNCGKENADNFRYCQFCGTALTASAVYAAIECDENGNIASSTISEPDPLSDWIHDDPNKDDFNSDDLPLLDENNATLIPVDVSLSGLEQALPEDESEEDEEDEDDEDDDEEEEEEDDEATTAYDQKELEIELLGSDPNNDLCHLSALTGDFAGNGNSISAKICQRCGALIADGHRFCGNCGSRYDSAYDLTKPDVPEDEMPEPSGSRVSIERMSFIQERCIMPDSDGRQQAEFTLCHINDNGTDGEYIPLFPGENIIGRGNSAALSADRYVSPKHIRIICNKDCARVEDFNSLNGAFFRISNDSIELHNGDIFRIGEELLCYFHGNSSQPLLTNQTAEATELQGGEEMQGWGYLRVILGAYSEGSVYRLWQPTVSLGRTHANIRFPRDGFVSGTHCTLQGARDGAILTDLDSSNGTFIRIKKSISVRKETYILIGNQLMRLSPR